MWNALRDLRNCCEKNQDTLLAIPKIGCGIDGLAWEKVQEMIEFIFHNSNIELCVYEDTKIVATITLQKEGDILMEPEWDRTMLKLAQDKDIFCQEVIKLVKEEDAQEASYYLSKDGILYRVENDGDKLIVPKTFIPKVMEDFHDSPMAGHPGQQKTLIVVVVVVVVVILFSLSLYIPTIHI
ncbi:hypothetical protein JTB14_008304 [Gonioctena quinquepunctata]|nr:hypothetical protein JTB14_008304 [Gonioctena quinquepunctata]